MHADEKTWVIPETKINFNGNKKNPLPQATTSITAQTIKESPVVKLTDLLKREQSIARIETHAGDTQSAVSLRGFGDNATANSLILIDGFPLTSPSLLTPHLNALLLSDIERIDIFQGSAGSLWGNQAIGGIMNIMTRPPEKRRVETKLGWGNQHTQFYSLSLGEKFSQGYFAKMSGFLNRTAHYRDHNYQSTIGVFPEVGMQHDKGLIDFRGQFLRDDIEFPGGLTEQQYFHHPTWASNFTNYSRFTSKSAQLFDQRELNHHWLLETRLSRQTIASQGIITLPFTHEETTTRLAPRLIAHVNHSKITLGYDGEWDTYQFDNVFVEKEAAVKQQDMYAQAVIPLDPVFNITLGTRYATQRQHFTLLSGKMNPLSNHVWVTETGFNFNFDNHWQFFVRRDENFRFPKSNEVLWANNFLRTQQGLSYEAGVSFQNSSHRLQLTSYRLMLHDEIAFDPTQSATTPLGSFYQFKKTKREGASIAELYHVTAALDFNAQLNYVNPRVVSFPYNGKMIPAVPVWNANAGLKYQFAPYWRVDYSTLYTGSRFPSEDVNNVSKKNSSYWLHSISLQYMKHFVTAGIEIANLTNERYANYVVYDPIANTNTYYPGAGRSYLLTVELNVI